MHITIIAAMDNDRAIGRSGTIPWRLPAEQRFFKRVTMGKPMIMGRKTHESIGRALPGRSNIVLSRNADYTSPGCEVAHTVHDAILRCEGAQEVMIIGGTAVYEAFLERADRMWLTFVAGSFGGDTFFPHYNPESWRIVEETHHDANERNRHSYRVVLLERIQTSQGAA